MIREEHEKKRREAAQLPSCAGKKSAEAGFARTGRRSVSRKKRPGMVVIGEATSWETNGAFSWASWRGRYSGIGCASL